MTEWPEDLRVREFPVLGKITVDVIAVVMVNTKYRIFRREDRLKKVRYPRIGLDYEPMPILLINPILVEV
jgi:hypothetical protein